MNVIIAYIFLRYWCRILEGACGAVDDFARLFGAAGVGMQTEPFSPGAHVGEAVHGG